MKLKNILITVRDMELSKRFYQELFGLYVITDFGENVILSEGLVLQEQKLWETFTGKSVRLGGCDAELYFEENDMDTFLVKLQNSDFNIQYVNALMEHDWGQRVVRIFDPDQHVIEVGEALEFVARRYLNMGWSVADTARKTQLPEAQIEMMVRAL